MKLIQLSVVVLALVICEVLSVPAPPSQPNPENVEAIKRAIARRAAAGDPAVPPTTPDGDLQTDETFSFGLSFGGLGYPWGGYGGFGPGLGWGGGYGGYGLGGGWGGYGLGGGWGGYGLGGGWGGYGLGGGLGVYGLPLVGYGGFLG